MAVDRSSAVFEGQEFVHATVAYFSLPKRIQVETDRGPKPFEHMVRVKAPRRRDRL